MQESKCSIHSHKKKIWVSQQQLFQSAVLGQLEKKKKKKNPIQPNVLVFHITGDNLFKIILFLKNS